MFQRKTLSEISPAVMSEMSDIELLCHAIHICGEDFLTEDYSFMKKISFQRLAQVICCCMMNQKVVEFIKEKLI